MPVLGWPSDISSISKAQADEFYGIYYSPQNITLILVGDFKTDDAERLARQYFERIPRGKKDPPDVVTVEVPQVAEKRMYAEADTNPSADLNWHSVPFGHRDSYALDVLAQLLSTRTGPPLQGPGTRIAGGHGHLCGAGLAKNGPGSSPPAARLANGHTPEEVEQAVYAELDKIKKDAVPAEELQKVKNQFAAGEYRRLSSNMAILQQLIAYDGEGDWREINNAGAKIQAVTAADVQRVANKYFTKENRDVGIYTRKAGGAKKEEAQ